MRIHRVNFIGAATKLEGSPYNGRPEFAFIGRSNVGKSSLINWLTGKDGLARVSKTPGRTREMNFFEINDRWTMVDLPGYGFAKVSKSTREQFNEFVSDYLLNRPNLRATFVLIDSRHPPQRIDLQFIEWLNDHDIPFALIFTKTDKSKASRIDLNIEAFQSALAEISGKKLSPTYFKVSTKSRDGKSEILALIDEVISQDE